MAARTGDAHPGWPETQPGFRPRDPRAGTRIEWPGSVFNAAIRTGRSAREDDYNNATAGMPGNLTTRIETTRNEWFHQNANDQVNHAGRAVETAKGLVEVDSVQQVADDRADRHYRHQQWLERSRRPYMNPNPGITEGEPL
jgi:hypothetical protein